MTLRVMASRQKAEKVWSMLQIPFVWGSRRKCCPLLRWVFMFPHRSVQQLMLLVHSRCSQPRLVVMFTKYNLSFPKTSTRGNSASLVPALRCLITHCHFHLSIPVVVNSALWSIAQLLQFGLHGSSWPSEMQRKKKPVLKSTQNMEAWLQPLSFENQCLHFLSAPEVNIRQHSLY